MNVLSKKLVINPLTYRVSASRPSEGYVWNVNVAVEADRRADQFDPRYFDQFDYPGNPNYSPPSVTDHMSAFASAYPMLRPAGAILVDWAFFERPSIVTFGFDEPRLFRILVWYAAKLIHRHSMPYAYEVQGTTFVAKRMKKRDR